MSDSELDACSYSIAQQLGHLLFSCSECVSQALSKLILAVLKGVHTLTNLPPRAMSSETEQRIVKCMRLQSQASYHMWCNNMPHSQIPTQITVAGGSHTGTESGVGGSE